MTNGERLNETLDKILERLEEVIYQLLLFKGDE